MSGFQLYKLGRQSSCRRRWVGSNRHDKWSAHQISKDEGGSKCGRSAAFDSTDTDTTQGARSARKLLQVCDHQSLHLEILSLSIFNEGRALCNYSGVEAAST